MSKSALEPKQLPEGPDEEPVTTGPSAIATELTELQRSIKSAMAKRQRLPQPLFWSLFHSRIEDIRKRREMQRILSQLLDG